MTQLAIGIDIGGTKVAGGLVDEEGQVLERMRRDTQHRSTCLLYTSRCG